MTGPRIHLTPDEAEFQAWKAAQKHDTGDDAEFDAWKASQGDFSDVSGGSSSMQVETPSDRMRGLAQSALNGLTFGNGDKVGAATRAVLPHALGGTKGFDYKGALADEKAHSQQFSQNHPTADAIANFAGSVVPVVAIGAPSGTSGLAKAAGSTVGQGFIWGAASGALGNTDGGLKGMAEGGAKGAAIGAATAPLVGAIGRGIGNVATRSGLTDAVESLASKINPEAGATLGTRGQINRALAGRQDILDAIGAPEASPAQIQLQRIQQTRETAGHLYGLAKLDKQTVDNPELNKLLSDPQVSRAYEIASKIREFAGNPLPQADLPPTMPLALQKMGVSPERYAELLKLNEQGGRVPVVSGVDILPPELMGSQETRIDVPDPEVLSSLKRYLSHAAAGDMKSKFPVKQEEALALLPKVQKIRDILHDISPAWKKADAFYADAKGQEEAFSTGYDAAKRTGLPAAKNLTKNTPEAVDEGMSKPRYATEPEAAMENRVNATREGAKASLAQQVKDQTIDQGLSGVLNAPGLAATENGIKTRSLMFADPQDATSLEQVLAAKRGKLLSRDGGSAPQIPGMRAGILQKLVKPLKEPNRLNSVKGQQLLTQRLGSPEMQVAEIGRFRKGKTMNDEATRILLSALAARAAR